MKKLCIAIIFCLCVAAGANAQCVDKPNDPCIPVHQTFVDDATKAFNLVVALRDELEKEKAAHGASDVTKAALQMQIDELNKLIAIKDRKEAVYQSLLDLRDQAFAVYEKVIKMQSDIIDRQWKQLNKGKSGWDKFLSAVKTVITLAAGVAIGRGGL